jgi:hypothetical protein
MFTNGQSVVDGQFESPSSFLTNTQHIPGATSLWIDSGGNEKIRESARSGECESIHKQKSDTDGFPITRNISLTVSWVGKDQGCTPDFRLHADSRSYRTCSLVGIEGRTRTKKLSPQPSEKIPLNLAFVLFVRLRLASAARRFSDLQSASGICAKPRILTRAKRCGRESSKEERKSGHLTALSLLVFCVASVPLLHLAVPFESRNLVHLRDHPAPLPHGLRDVVGVG